MHFGLHCKRAKSAQRHITHKVCAMPAMVSITWIWYFCAEKVKKKKNKRRASYVRDVISDALYAKLTAHIVVPTAQSMRVRRRRLIPVEPCNRRNILSLLSAFCMNFSSLSVPHFVVVFFFFTAFHSWFLARYYALSLTTVCVCLRLLCMLHTTFLAHNTTLV